MTAPAAFDLRSVDADAPGIQTKIAMNYPIRAPLRVNWDMTNACNLGCLHCYAASGKPMPDELTDEEIVDFARRLADEQILDVTVAGGEPFIRPIAMSALEVLAKGDVRTSVVTNGTFVTPELARRLAELGLRRVHVSVDGASASTHDAIRVQPGSFAMAVRALRLLNDAGTTTGLNVVVTSKNIAEIPDVVELAIGLGCTAVSLLRFIPTGRGRQFAAMLAPSDDAMATLAASMKDRIDRWRRHLTFSTSDLGLYKVVGHSSDDGTVPFALHEGCQAGRTLAWVDARGDVYGCVYLPIPYGNVREASLREIWGRTIVRDVRVAAVESGMTCGSCIEASRNLVRFFKERPVSSPARRPVPLVASTPSGLNRSD